MPRSLDSVDVAAVNGNYALAAGMDLLSALKLEEMPEEYKNLVAVKTADIEAPFTKDLKEAIESPEFEKVIDEEFKGFVKPKWMQER